MILLTFKIGFTAIIVAFIVAIAATCIEHDRTRKIMFYVIKGFFAVAVVTLIPAMLANIWSA